MLGIKNMRRLLACLFAAHAVLVLTLMGANYGRWAWPSPANLTQWRALQMDYSLCERDVPKQYIPSGENGGMREVCGAVLFVPGWGPIPERPLGNVYYSGNAPYKNEPPDFALARRTMLDILVRVNLGPDSVGWGREQSVALTYLGRICPLLLGFSQRALGREELQTMLTKASSAYQGTKTLLCWNVVEGLLEKLEKNALTSQGALEGHSALLSEVDDLRSKYNACMRAYREELGQPEACGRDYSTHCEIMYLYDMWCAADPEQSQLVLVGRDNPAPVDSLFHQYSEKGYLLPEALIISKPMCENCEKNIVRAWTGVDKDLYVVTERKPNRGEELRHDPASRVKKIDSPLDGRDSYVPTA